MASFILTLSRYSYYLLFYIIPYNMSPQFSTQKWPCHICSKTTSVKYYFFFLSISSVIAFCCVCFFPCFATFFWLSRSLASTDSLGLSLSFTLRTLFISPSIMLQLASSAISALRRYSPLSMTFCQFASSGSFLFCCGSCSCHNFASII